MLCSRNVRLQTRTSPKRTCNIIAWVFPCYFEILRPKSLGPPNQTLNPDKTRKPILALQTGPSDSLSWAKDDKVLAPLPVFLGLGFRVEGFLGKLITDWFLVGKEGIYYVRIMEAENDKYHLGFRGWGLGL